MLSLSLSLPSLAVLGGGAAITKIVIVTAGQSNDSGRGTNNQVYTSTVQPAAQLFSNANVLGDVIDPTDSAVGQVDSVSADTSPAAAGSMWPLALSRMLDYWASVGASVPQVVLVPCARGGTSITAWLPGEDHEDRTTLYGSMVYRARQTGAGQPGVLTIVSRLQGETDAGNGMAEETYASHLRTFVDAVYADLRAVTVPHTLPRLTATGYVTGAPAINAAIMDAWGTDHVAEGADLRTVRCDAGDGIHMVGDWVLSIAADKVSQAVSAALGKPSGLVASVNLVSGSDTIDTTQGLTVSANQAVNPLTGQLVVDQVTTASDGASSTKYASKSVTPVIGTVYTVSIVAKAVTGQYIQLRCSTALGSGYANFDLVNGTVTRNGSVAHIDDLGDGWYRCAVTTTAASSSAATVRITAVSTGTANVDAFGPDGVAYLVGAVQVEARLGPGPYVPN